MVFRLELGKYSAAGMGRSNNEDNVGYYFPHQPEVILLRGQMFLVADGNGSEGLGEFASKIAIQTVIQEYYEEPWVGTVAEMLTKSLLRANRTVYEANVENRSATPFTTSLSCGVIHQDRLYIAHVGTCRVFLLSNMLFEPLTRSHTIDMEKADPDADIREQETDPIVVRTLGTDEDVSIDVIQRKLQINDTILLCSDGLYKAVDEQEIQQLIASGSPQQACEMLVKQAVANQTPDDATALLVKVKSLKRLEADEKPAGSATAASSTTDRQIVIKGIRYRSPMKEENLPPAEKESVEEFSRGREVRRPIIRRTAAKRSSKPRDSLRQIFNILTLVVFIAFVGYLAIRYVPGYWQSFRSSRDNQAVVDTLAGETPSQPTYKEQPPAEQPTPAIAPPVIEKKDTTEQQSAAPPPATTTVRLNVVIVDGSFRRDLSWNSFIDAMKKFSRNDRITTVPSSYRLQKSKILWRRSDSQEQNNAVRERALQYQRLFAQYFQVQPEISPLDVTLVIGANFVMPRLQTSYREAQVSRSFDYFVEILNGFTVPGLARRVSEQLNYRLVNGKRIGVVDYRNADRKNYRLSFIKCDPSQNDIAEQLASLLAQRFTIVNQRLFDIKLIVGTDIKF